MEILGLLPFALLLICPLAMIVMMRGMHGGKSKHDGHGAGDTESDPATARKLAAMEREITELRGELDAASSVERTVQGRNGGRG